MIKEKFIYFAYGSNMLSKRLQHSTRCPSAVPIDIAIMADHELAFSKRSVDTSGKAAPKEILGSSICGVLFEIEANERTKLDGVEGSDYFAKETVVQICSSGKRVSAITYLAKEQVKGLIPYDWYHALVLAGAIEHNLTKDYQKFIGSFETCVDPELDRKTRLDALTVLKESRFDHLIS